jgi:hypothetical protein
MIRCPACGAKLDLIELKLTPRQRDIREAVEQLVKDRHRPVKSVEIATAVGYADSTIRPELKTLEAMGVLTRPNGRKSGYDGGRHSVPVSPGSDSFQCPCCGKPMANTTILSEIDFDPAKWLERVNVLVSIILDSTPEKSRDQALAEAGMIVSANLLHTATQTDGSDFISRPQEEAPVFLVYFAQSVNGGPIKIGISVDPLKRVRSIPYHDELILLATLPGGRKLEKKLHNRFSACRLQGEWFEPSHDILDFIKDNQGRRRVADVT